MKTAVIAFLGCTFCAQSAMSQQFPQRPIRVVVPFAAGGVSDIIVRAVSDPVGKALGQPIVIENRGGAGGTIGAEYVARATPDGHVLLLGAGALTLAPSLYKNLSYDPARDFAPVALAAKSSYVLAAHPVVPASSVKDLIQLAKSKPGQLRYASSGIGAGTHLTAELFKYMARVDILHVPYKGSAPMMADLIGGHVDIAFDSIGTAVSYVRSGKLKALAVTSASRSPILPEVRTVSESGLPSFETTAQFAFVAPQGTPAPIIERLSQEITRALNSTDAKSRLLAVGLEPATATPEQLASLLHRERFRWAAVVQSAGIRVE
jgi:tripartite-type tricarboxylate transporter receptor subunit TctC